MNMRVLFLGYTDSPLISFLRDTGEEVVVSEEKMTLETITELAPDFVVSYGYRYIIKRDILDRFPGKIVNLHIAYLPWNRGADPNFWSNLEGTPSGVTIHHIDAGIDTGDIIAQERVAFDESDTLATSYQKLREAMEALFKKHWPEIKAGDAPHTPQQPEAGTTHWVKDKEPFAYLTEEKKWDTPLKKLRENRQEHAVIHPPKVA